MNLHAFRNRLTKLFRIVKKEVLVVSFWIFVGTLCLWGFDEAGMLSRNSQIKEVVVDFPEVYQVWKKDEAVFVDGRSNAAFKRGHIPGAMSVPVGKVKKRLALLPEDKNTRLIVYCSSAECPIGYLLLRKLQRHGYTNVQIFHRGIEGWRQFGYPLQKTVQPSKESL